MLSHVLDCILLMPLDVVRNAEVFEYATGSSWYPGQELPDNQHWRKLPPLNTIPLVDGDSAIWLGSVADGSFQKFVRNHSSPALSIWRASKTPIVEEDRPP